MKNFNHFIRIFIMAAMAVGIAGCDVSKDENEKAAMDLKQTKTAMEEPAVGIATMEKAGPGDVGIQKQLAAAQEKAETLTAQVKNLTEENNRLQGLLEKLQASYAELEKKLADFQAAGKDLKSGLPLNP